MMQFVMLFIYVLGTEAELTIAMLGPRWRLNEPSEKNGKVVSVK